MNDEEISIDVNGSMINASLTEILADFKASENLLSHLNLDINLDNQRKRRDIIEASKMASVLGHTYNILKFNTNCDH